MIFSVFWASAMAAVGSPAPCNVQENAACPPQATPALSALPSVAAGSDDEVTTIARMLRARTDLSWLMSSSEADRIRPLPDQEAEARKVLALAQVARSRGLDRRGDTKAALRALETAVLAEAERRDLLNMIEVTDATVAAALVSRPGRYDEFRLSHIFVAAGDLPDGRKRTDDDAKLKAEQLRRRIIAGEDFAVIAKQESDDPSTAGAGGELPSMFGRYMADEFFPHARLLGKGQVSAPVRGKSGYHLLRLEERFAATPATARFMVTEDIREEAMPGLIADAIRKFTR